MSQEGSQVNELFFTGPGDPRHKCVAIGFHNGTPVVYKFETVDLKLTREGVFTTAVGHSSKRTLAAWHVPGPEEVIGHLLDLGYIAKDQADHKL